MWRSKPLTFGPQLSEVGKFSFSVKEEKIIHKLAVSEKDVLSLEYEFLHLN